jgi:hypothetical protein
LLPPLSRTAKPPLGGVKIWTSAASSRCELKAMTAAKAITTGRFLKRLGFMR